MAIFGTDTKKKTVKANTKVTIAAATPVIDDGRLSGVLKAPWFSEKALIGTEKGVYVFQIPERSTKPDVAAAIKLFYNVTPKKIRIVNLPAKKTSLRTRRGTGLKARRHKAYVYLNAGDTLNLV
jgi:large subunit ribosomal protein L23